MNHFHPLPTAGPPLPEPLPAWYLHPRLLPSRDFIQSLSSLHPNLYAEDIDIYFPAQSNPTPVAEESVRQAEENYLFLLGNGKYWTHGGLEDLFTLTELVQRLMENRAVLILEASPVTQHMIQDNLSDTGDTRSFLLGNVEVNRPGSRYRYSRLRDPTRSQPLEAAESTDDHRLLFNS